jgi:hypothetical protein
VLCCSDLSCLTSTIDVDSLIDNAGASTRELCSEDKFCRLTDLVSDEATLDIRKPRSGQKGVKGRKVGKCEKSSSNELCWLLEFPASILRMRGLTVLGLTSVDDGAARGER